MERIIFTLSFEKKWDCWIVFANLATDAGDFFLATGRYWGGNPDAPAVVKEIVPLIQKYDLPALFRQFGRKKYKDEREFLLKVEEEYIREFIRPYIEKWVVRVIDSLADAGFPLFMKGGRLDNFYKDQRIFMQSLPLRALLKFERTGEFTRYVLRLTDGGRVFYPNDYDLKILTRCPCRVLSGKQLYRFPEDFDGQRLVPFLQKREIMIPKANEQLYFRKFILKNVRHEEIEVQGFEVIVREMEKKALLSLEREIFAMPVLVLEYCYGDQRIPAWSGRKALVELHSDGEDYAFYKVNRDLGWETEQEEIVRSFGLKELSTGCFRVAGVIELPGRKEKKDENNEETSKEVEAAWIKTIAWIRIHRVDLQNKGIGFTQKTLHRSYYTGTWQVNFSVQEGVDWFGLKAEVLLENGSQIPLWLFRDYILSGRRDYLLPDGTVFFIPEEWFATYSGILMFATGKGASLILHKNQYALLDKTGIVLEEGGMKNCSGEVELPLDLRAALRPYQQIGYQWLYGLYRNGLGGCLADDMGLGKTLQVITLLLKYRQEAVKSDTVRKLPETGTQLSLLDIFKTSKKENMLEKAAEYNTCLIIVPASLMHNWRNELRKFAPQLTVTSYAGHHRMELRPYLQRSDVVLVTYHTLRNDIDYFAKLFFGIVVADEAQMIKNPDSQLHKAILMIQGKCFYALSGTPVENSLTDLWAILNFVNRNMLGTHYFFKSHFIKPILADFEGQASQILQKLIAPYVLRRTKEEVLAELPELTSELVVCEPEPEQRKVYESEQSRVRNYILEKQEAQEGIRSDRMVLRALIRLRQIANHPRLVDSEYVEDSGKFREIFRMLNEVVESGHKVLVFSSFVKYLKLVADEIVVRGWKYAMLTGITLDREQQIHYFATDPDCRIFLISLKAGGVGLNLTAADYVFILDPWWNLAAENQAVSRAHRMGQKQAVFVYRFITAGTLEEKILAIQQRKQRLADSIISAATQLPLTDEELLEALK